MRREHGDVVTRSKTSPLSALPNFIQYRDTTPNTDMQNDQTDMNESKECLDTSGSSSVSTHYTLSSCDSSASHFTKDEVETSGSALDSSASSHSTESSATSLGEHLESVGILTERDEFVRFIVDSAKYDVVALHYIQTYLQLQPSGDCMILPKQTARIAEMLRVGILDTLAVHLPSIDDVLEWKLPVLKILSIIASSMQDMHVQALCQHAAQFLERIRGSVLTQVQRDLPESGMQVQVTALLLQILSNAYATSCNTTSRVPDVDIVRALHQHWLPHFILDTERNGAEKHGREEALICCLRFLCSEESAAASRFGTESSSLHVCDYDTLKESVSSVINLLTCCSSNLEVNHWLTEWLDHLIRFHPTDGQRSMLTSLAAQVTQGEMTSTKTCPDTFVRFKQLLDHPSVWPETKANILCLIGEIVGEDNPVFTDWFLHAELLSSVCSLLFDQCVHDPSFASEELRIRTAVHQHASLILSNVAAGSDEQRHQLLLWRPNAQRVTETYEPPQQQQQQQQQCQAGNDENGDAEDNDITDDDDIKSSWIVRRCIRLVRDKSASPSLRTDILWTLSSLMDVEWEWYARVLLDKHLPSLLLHVLRRPTYFTQNGISLALDILHRLQQSPWSSVRSRMRHWCIAHHERLLQCLTTLQSVPNQTIMLPTSTTLLEQVRSTAMLWVEQEQQNRQKVQQSSPTLASTSVTASAFSNETVTMQQPSLQ